MSRLKEQLTLAMGMVVITLEEEERAQQEKKRLWSRPWLAQRKESSQYKNLVAELSLKDHESFRSTMCVDRDQFFELLELVRPAITKVDTNMRRAITAQERLAMTLRHLTTGANKEALSQHFCVSRSLISSILPSVCTAIYQALQPHVMKVPDTHEEWKAVATSFAKLWNFPMCLGALNGKIVAVDKPGHISNSEYFSKGKFNVYLVALVDANHKFLYLDVGACEKNNDSSAWPFCTLKDKLEKQELNIPPPENIPISHRSSSYVVVASNVFPLTKEIVNHYPLLENSLEKRAYNYRLERARRVAENAVGVLSSRFQIFQQPIRASPERAMKIIQTTTVLHNYLCMMSKETYCPPELLDREDISNGRLIEGEWRNNPHKGMKDFNPIAQYPTREAYEVRDTLCHYFSEEGRVVW